MIVIHEQTPLQAHERKDLREETDLLGRPRREKEKKKNGIDLSKIQSQLEKKTNLNLRRPWSANQSTQQHIKDYNSNKKAIKY